MSRMGNKPINLPPGTTLEQNGDSVTLNGPNGKLELTLPEGITIENKDGKLHVMRTDDSKKQKMLHGTTRSLINAMVTGVTTGFTVNLELFDVGYRASVAGQKMTFNLGYSKPIEFTVPDDVKVTMPDQTHISLKSNDKHLVGQVAATIRGFRPPDSYHGKGVRYAGEQIILKEGKKA